MHRLSVFLFALVAISTGAIATAAIVSPSNALCFFAALSGLRDFIMNISGSIISYCAKIPFRVNESLVSDGKKFSDQIIALEAASQVFCDEVIQIVTSRRPTLAHTSQCLQSLSKHSTRKGKAPESFVSLALWSYCTKIIFVLFLLGFPPVRQVLAMAKQAPKRIAEHRRRLDAAYEAGTVPTPIFLLGVFLLNATWALMALINLARYLPSIQFGKRSRPGPAPARARAPAPARAPAAAAATQRQRSTVDPAVVERNMRINQLEIELMEWRQLVHAHNMDHAREENRLSEHIALLERANTSQAARLREARAVHESLGLTSDAQATIRAQERMMRDLRDLLDAEIARGAAREKELLADVRTLEGRIAAEDREDAERRERNWLYRAYINEVNKWKYIARESVSTMKAAQRQVRELEVELEVEREMAREMAKTGGGGRASRAGSSSGSADSTGGVEQGAPSGGERNPFDASSAHGDDAPGRTYGLDDAVPEDDDAWETASGSSGGGDGGDREKSASPVPFGLSSSRIGWATDREG